MSISNFLKNDFRKGLTKPQAKDLKLVNTREAAAKFISANSSLFSTMQNSTNEEDLAKQFFDSIGEAKKIAHVKIFKGDLVSAKVDDKFIKGKMFEEKADSYTLEHLSKGKIEVPKSDTIKFFYGQKFDIRELDKVVSTNYSHKFRINDIPKPDKIKLLKGEETSVLNVQIKVNGEMSKEDNIRMKINKTQDGSIYMNVIQAYENKVYNKQVSSEDVSKLKNGEEISSKFTTKAGKEYTAVLYWDKDMNGIRTKTPDKKGEQKNLNIDKAKSNKKSSGKGMKM